MSHFVNPIFKQEVLLTAPQPVSKPVAHAPEGHDPPPKRASFLRVAVLLVFAGGIFVVLGLAGWRAVAKQASARDETSAAQQSARPRVLLAKAEKAPAQIEQVLPATSTPLRETAVYARTSGYLKRWLVDIGATVTEGQLLAEIETPEIDAQLLQAKATLAESKATLERNRATLALTKVNFDRAARLVRTTSVSQQDYDEADAATKVAAATINVTEATIAANEANIRRLSDLQKFQKVVAPFAGVITARNFDSGALIVADNASAKELFHLVQLDTLRVVADVPQTFATSVQPGQLAGVFRREAPGKEFPGKVARTTNSVDPRTRTLRVEVDVPNADKALLPGMYLQVRFKLDGPSGIVRVPGATIITRAAGAKVALLQNGAIHYRTVQLGRDFGTVVEVVSGLEGGETLIVRPGDDLPEGTLVEVVK